MVNTASLDELLKKIEAENGDGWGRWTMHARYDKGGTHIWIQSISNDDGTN